MFSSFWNCDYVLTSLHFHQSHTEYRTAAKYSNDHVLNQCFEARSRTTAIKKLCPCVDKGQAIATLLSDAYLRRTEVRLLLPVRERRLVPKGPGTAVRSGFIEFVYFFIKTA